MKSISEIYSILEVPQNIVITFHQKPDADAMGSGLALYHFLVKGGHKVDVISPTNWSDWLNWMPSVDKVIDFELNKNLVQQLVNEANCLFCLDFNVISRTKNLAPVLENIQATKVLIDHHQQPDVEYFDFGTSDTSKSSTCEMVYDFIVGSGKKELLDETIASCLYAGVMTDTGSFRFPGATASTHRMIADLKDCGISHTQIHENIYDNFHENRVRFLGYVLLKRMEIFYEYNTAIIWISKRDLFKFEIKTGDTDGLVNYPLTIKGIKFAALVIDRDEERKWSFRSKGNIDVNTFARKYFNGGGHFNAAGGRSNDSLESTIEFFKKVLKENAAQLL